MSKRTKKERDLRIEIVKSLAVNDEEKSILLQHQINQLGNEKSERSTVRVFMNISGKYYCNKEEITESEYLSCVSKPWVIHVKPLPLHNKSL